ncbi:persephin [Rhineura floridana]|uniref:persephin n=1 Tax=Rhineura floridana TaxID=261503 RepID=UPI002AC84BEC|nr:persephin [Rhineura floridana]
MGAPQLLCSLSLVLAIQIVPSQPTEGKSLMMQMSGTGIRDVPRTLLGMTTACKFISKGASLSTAGLQNIPSRPFPGPAMSRPKRRTWERTEERECRLQSLLVRIKDLGLGYNSEETILFKYCSGSCPKARSNHDLTLSILLQRSEIPALGDPCCRPTHFEDVAFLDDGHQWHEVEKLSASACSCVG